MAQRRFLLFDSLYPVQGGAGMRKLNFIFTIGMILMVVLAFSATTWADDAAKVNINKASVEELVTLKRVGPKYAQKIVDYRTQNGAFKTAEDITKVPGIGPKTWEANKDRITIK